VGIDLNSPKVVASVRCPASGRNNAEAGSPAPIDRFQRRGNSQFPDPVVDDDMGSDGTDMLLGMDFFLSHHVFIARSQNVIYLTYNGGPIFPPPPRTKSVT
jgi:hypothetical protein